MNSELPVSSNIAYVSNFNDLVSTTFSGTINAICWPRTLPGNFDELIQNLNRSGTITEVSAAHLRSLILSDEGNTARQHILQDLTLLQEHGAMPCLNVITCYERDDQNPVFPTDVYSFHVDRAPVPGSTFLCTYYGASSEIIANHDAEQKVLLPSVREALQHTYVGPPEGFEAFIKEHFYDLHYEALPHAQPITLGLGHLWRLAIDYPQCEVLPCIHRAPKEKDAEPRLLLIS